MLNYYKLLQVDESADDEIIEIAYKKLAKRYHPDICNENDALEMMRKINEAYEVLSVPSYRIKYDIQLRHASQSSRTSYSTKSNNQKLEDKILIRAQHILREYFEAIIKKDFNKCYQLVSPNQRDSMSLSAFKNWQHWTSRIYDLIEFNLSVGEYTDVEKKHEICADYIITFNVEAVEYNQIMEHFERSHFIKQVIILNNTPYVYLEQIEVSDIIKRYEKLSKLKVGKWKMGKLRLGFNISKGESWFFTQLENELERFDRYKIPFSLVFLRIVNADDSNLQSITDELRNIISKNIRKLDSFVLINKHTFLILLPSTHVYESKLVAEKICDIATSTRSLMMYPFIVRRIVIENEMHIYDEVKHMIQQVITEINLDEVKT